MWLFSLVLACHTPPANLALFFDFRCKLTQVDINFVVCTTELASDGEDLVFTVTAGSVSFSVRVLLHVVIS